MRQKYLVKLIPIKRRATTFPDQQKSADQPTAKELGGNRSNLSTSFPRPALRPEPISSKGKHRRNMALRDGASKLVREAVAVPDCGPQHVCLRCLPHRLEDAKKSLANLPQDAPEVTAPGASASRRGTNAVPDQSSKLLNACARSRKP